MTTHDVFDITIIGAGPSGLFAAFYAGLRDAKTKIVDLNTDNLDAAASTVLGTARSMGIDVVD